MPAELAGRRLDQAAALLLPEFSRSRLKTWIDAGRLTLAGQSARARTLLKGGEELALVTELEAAVEVAPEPIPLIVVHEDDALLVIDKPVGLVVHPGAGNRSGTLQNALLHRYPDARRRCRGRASCTGSTRTRADCCSSHGRSRARRRSRRRSRRAASSAPIEAICQGVLTGGGSIDAPIGRHPRERTRMGVVEGGREARTRYRVLARFRAHTRCEIELETGRTHQIRVHMAHIRAPLVGDPVYGGRPRLPPQPSDELRAALQGFRRQALHAVRLELEHPASGEALRFDSALAPDLRALLDALRADAKVVR